MNVVQDMDHRQRILAVVILTLIISLSFGYISETVRESMVFSWAIEEGNVFDFDVLVMGNTSSGSTTIPPPYAIMNNTRIRVMIVSLPNVSIIFYASSFIDNIIEYQKTSCSFVNGTDIPVAYYTAINTVMSQCMVPIGGWNHLDALFPNDINRPFMEQESYLSQHLGSSFYLGYKKATSNSEREWHGIIDLDSGVPLEASFQVYQVGQPWTHSYNVTMTLVG